VKAAMVVAVAALMALAVLAGTAAADPTEYDFESSEAGLSTAQAGAHPDVTLGFTLKTDPASEEQANGLHAPYARTKDISVELPPGVLGNPNAVSQCSMAQFESFAVRTGTGCSFGAQVGVVHLLIYSFESELVEPIYNMVPPNDQTVARLGFYAGVFPNFIDVRVRSGSDYGLTANIEGVPAAERLVAAKTTLWGVPADASHDTLRLTPEEALVGLASHSPARSSGVEPAPFMTNPTSCGGPLDVRTTADNYQVPDATYETVAQLPAITGCGLLDFEPELTLAPTTSAAASPAGLDAILAIPQDEEVNGLATSQMRSATVTLPKEMSINSAAADGLSSCSAAEVGYEHEVPSGCPEAAKIGSVELDIPQLRRRIKGWIYQRTPEPGHLFRIWLVSDELGVHVKIPGEIHTDPSTGQVTSVFVDTPQVPVRTLKLHFKGGPRGVLITPDSCGIYSSTWEFGPWSGMAPASGTSSFSIDQNCGTGGFKPGFSAGSTNVTAGSFTHFVLDLTRNDGERNVTAIDTTLPPGLLAKLKGVPLCDGGAAASGACSAASQVGTLAVAAGAGSNPLWIPQPGKAPTALYLGGPYKGAPYSMVIKVPAQAGPFDLGTVVTRAGIYIDPGTTAATVKSDPLPQILEGVPIDYRAIHVEVNRPEFIINPTSCAPSAVRGTVSGTGGASAAVSSPFQAASCASLGFKPKLSISLSGSMKRTGFPKLKAVLTPRPGDANIGKTSVVLPHSSFLEQGHIGTVCTRVQFAADQCPAKSVYGRAEAVSPLLDQPLEGNVYLRSNGGERELPDLVAALKGQIDVNVVGFIDSVKGRLRTRFVSVPDAPVSNFVLEMAGGKNGLLTNSVALCKAKSRASVKMTGQNGRTYNSNPVLKTACRGSSVAGRIATGRSSLGGRLLD
jgi:hypothetical protein